MMGESLMLTAPMLFIPIKDNIEAVLGQRVRS